MYHPAMSEQNVKKLYLLKLKKRRPMTKLLDQILNEYFEHNDNQSESKEGGKSLCMSVKSAETLSKSNVSNKERITMISATGTVPSAELGTTP